MIRESSLCFVCFEKEVITVSAESQFEKKRGMGEVESFVLRPDETFFKLETVTPVGSMLERREKWNED